MGVSWYILWKKIFCRESLNWNKSQRVPSQKQINLPLLLLCPPFLPPLPAPWFFLCPLVACFCSCLPFPLPPFPCCLLPPLWAPPPPPPPPCFLPDMIGLFLGGLLLTKPCGCSGNGFVLSSSGISSCASSNGSLQYEKLANLIRQKQCRIHGSETRADLNAWAGLLDYLPPWQKPSSLQ